MKKLFTRWPKIMTVLFTTLIIGCASTGVNPASKQAPEINYPQMTIPAELREHVKSVGATLLGSVVDNWGNIMLFVEYPDKQCAAWFLFIDGRVLEDTCEIGQRVYQKGCVERPGCNKNPYEIDPNQTTELVGPWTMRPLDYRDIPKPGGPDPLPVANGGGTNGRGYSDEKAI